jgi:beta-lactamase regulating signal transducer with metallopeptidase domain
MILFSWLVKASLLVAVVAIVQTTLGRHASAATRHAIWSLTVVGLLLLPVLSFTLPGWKVIPLDTPRVAAALSDRLPPTAARVNARPTDSVSRAPNAVAFQWGVVLPVMYVAIAVLLLARLAAQRLAIQRLARRATEVTASDWTRLLAECAATVGILRPLRLLTSREQAMPAMFGMRRPAIVLPAGAEGWSEDRRRAVLLHELAHIARCDCLWQTLAAVACAIYWIHPGLWWIARRMRVERELACDDSVLFAGINAYDYADHLLELAYALLGYRMSPLAIEMANPRHLERRLVALVDSTRHRDMPTRTTWMAVFALVVFVVAPISAATVTAREGGSAQSTTDEPIGGLWEIRPAATAGFVEMRLCHADLFAVSEIPVRELEGLSLEWLSGANRPFRLILRRDAGTFTLDGTVGRGAGSGTYTFATEPRFPEDFQGLGFEPPSAAMAARWPGLGSWTHTLALYNVGFESLDALRQQESRKLAWPEFVRMKQHQALFGAMHEAFDRGSVRTSNWC